MRVLKKDKSIVAYDRNKIIIGLEKACYKTSLSAEQIQQVANEVEADIFKNFERKVPSTFIAESVMTYLRYIDKVAYIRFASVYNDFRDTDKLLKEAREQIGEVFIASSTHAIEQVELVINLADDITYEEVTSLLDALESLSFGVAGSAPNLNEIQIGEHTEEHATWEGGD